MNRMRDPRLSMFGVYESVNGKWTYAESIQAPSADAAAHEWMQTRPQHRFSIREAPKAKYASRRLSGAD